jgi:hypothetical protein
MAERVPHRHRHVDVPCCLVVVGCGLQSRAKSEGEPQMDSNQPLGDKVPDR